MKKRFVALCLGGLMGFTVILSACGPAIPHAAQGRNDCISCHSQGAVKPFPEWHAERGLGNDTCLNCHKLAGNTAS